MQTFSQEIPVSQIQLDRQAALCSKIELANRSVLDCVTALMEFDDPMAPNIFGADRELLRQLASMPKSKVLPLLMTGIPIFSVRLATHDFKSVLDNNEGTDAALKALLKTFGDALPLTSLSR